MFNGLWCQAGEKTQEWIEKVKASNFQFLGVQVGDQLNDGSIKEFPLPGEIPALIKVLHDNGLKAYAWIQSNIRSPADLSAASRPRYLAAISALMKRFDLDGLITNVEARTNSNHVDFANFLNEVTALCHSMGRLHITAMVAGDGELFEKAGVFSSLKLDYLSPMLYNGADYWTRDTFRYFWNWYLGKSPCPVLPGLIANDYDGRSLGLKLRWVSELVAETSYPKLAGFKVFWNATLTPTDWLDWQHWPVKAGGMFAPVQTPTPTPMHLATVCGLDADQIERLRTIGHATLDKDAQDLYHKIGPDVAAYLKTHKDARRIAKEILEGILELLP